MDDKVKIGLVIQARMSSTRLPGKILLPLPKKKGAKTVISHIIERSKLRTHKKFVQKTIVASSNHAENDALETYLSKEFPDVECFRGSEHDVLSRFVKIQDKNKFDYVVRLTADNPCIDHRIIEEVLIKTIDADIEYAYTMGYPLGTNVEVFKGALLENLDYGEITNNEKEHVTLKFKWGNYKVKGFLASKDIISHSKSLRLTLDEELDYQTLCKVFKSFEDNNFTIQKIIDLYFLNPSIFTANNEVEQKKGYGFPDKYAALTKQKFQKGPYSIIPIRYKDRIRIMNWRNEQIYHLRQSKPLTPKMQNKYYDNVVSKLFEMEKPDQLLFSFLKNDDCIGYGGLVHINWVDRNAEISFIMNTQLEKEFFNQNWGVFLSLIEEVAQKQLALHKIYVYAFDLRPKLYEVLLENAYFEDGRLKDHCYFDGNYKDVVIHSKLLS